MSNDNLPAYVAKAHRRWNNEQTIATSRTGVIYRVKNIWQTAKHGLMAL